MFKFKFADIGEGLHEGVVAEIYKKEGDMVKEGEALFSVETDKVTSDIPSPVTGKIIKVAMFKGDTIHVGQEIYQIEDGSSSSSSVGIKTEAPKKAGGGGASVVGEVAVSDEVMSFGRVNSNSSNSQSQVSPREIVQSASISATPENRRALARAKMLGQSVVFETNTLNSSESSNRRALARAKMLGQSPEIVSKPVSIQQIQQNVEKAVSNSQVQPLISLANELKREKVTPIRKAIAKAMKNSWSNVAYTNLVNEINVGSLVSLREKIKDSVQDLTGVKVTFLPFIIKAITLALKEFPVLMAKYDEQASELVYSGTLNIGIAVDTEAGLMVPVIKNADKLNIIEIAKEITRLAVAARDKKIKADELKGSDFTVTNYASVGSLFGIPVINYPDMAIAGIGVIKDEPIVTKNGIVAGKIMNLTVAADHRWVDGATIGRFAQKVKHFLENPELLGVF